LRAAERVRYPQHVEPLAAGAAVLLYTDGLVERRHESLDVGLDRLRAAAVTAPTDLTRLADHLLDELLPGRDPGDDVAMLAMRDVADRGGLALDLPAWPRELAGLRRNVREWLDRAGVAEPAAEDVVLAVNEAASNTIEHAYGLRDAQFAVRAHRDGDTVIIEVSDNGDWRAPAPPSDRGRGLDLIRSLMDDVNVQVGPGGTTVRLTRRV
jgi:anti-sigma regulatory factor (Ser/Thr protein kinase)